MLFRQFHDEEPNKSIQSAELAPLPDGVTTSSQSPEAQIPRLSIGQLGVVSNDVCGAACSTD